MPCKSVFNKGQNPSVEARLRQGDRMSENAMGEQTWEEHAVALIEKAVLAPSSHNSQPWVFLLGDPMIDLLADRSRALPVNDPNNRELIISCGCALQNLRVAAAAHNVRLGCHLLPEHSDPDWLARVMLSLEPAESDECLLAELAAFISERHTHRRRFKQIEVPESIIAHLVKAASCTEAWLHPFTTESMRDQTAALIAEADTLLWANPEWRRELADWVHGPQTGDGLRVPAFISPIAQALLRTFDMGGGIAAKDRVLAQGSPLLALLGTPNDTPRDWMHAGMALQHVLLLAKANGLQASFLNQPIQVPALRPRLLDLAGRKGSPQVLIRIGFPAEETPASPRRPLDEVILWA